MNVKTRLPDYLFEVSWEVCNKVGGIYTVLSTHAKVLEETHKNKLYFIGPDLHPDESNPLFTEDEKLGSEWKKTVFDTEGLKVRVGRWNIPGNPMAILVDFNPIFTEKNEIYARMWETYGVDSLHGYGDYDTACMFSIAAAKVIASFYHAKLTMRDQVVCQVHEWMCGMAALYLEMVAPEIATIFTTHATSIGRSIAFNNKKLYAYFEGYNGDQMASELHIESKHSVEKQTARYVDCFTTVSEITNRECTHLLEKPADVILKNGFNADFVPPPADYTRMRTAARTRLLSVAHALTGKTFGQDTLIVCTSGRHEFRNKGLDITLDALSMLQADTQLPHDIVAYLLVPGWSTAPRADLKQHLEANASGPLPEPYITHHLHADSHDPIASTLAAMQSARPHGSKVTVIYVPCYLDGHDGIIDLSYYDTLIGTDLTLYPSYYEPWGYTPLESIAFRIPTLCTDLSGFGLWVNETLQREGRLADGVEVIHRTDDNTHEVVDRIAQALRTYQTLPPARRAAIADKCHALAQKALWKNFIKAYYEAYRFALEKNQQRLIDSQCLL